MSEIVHMCYEGKYWRALSALGTETIKEERLFGVWERNFGYANEALNR